MMAHHQNPHCLPGDPKQKMIGETAQIDSSKVSLAKRNRLGFCSNRRHCRSKLSIKIVRKFPSRHPLIVVHDTRQVGENPGMENHPHHARRLEIRRSSSSSERPASGFKSNSPSRSRASASPSSSSCITGGSDSSKCAARVARCDSGSSNASFSTSRSVLMP